MTRDQLHSGRGRLQSPARTSARVRRLNKATVAAAVDSAGTGRLQTCVTVNINMTWYHPKYYAALRKRAREQAIQETVPHNDIEEANKPTSSQASGGKHPNRRSRVQAASQNAQAQGSEHQGTSAQAHDPGCKQQG